MAIELFHIDWTKLQPFDKALNQSASQAGGVYGMFRLVGRTYKLYYIGMSKDFAKRFSTHRANASHLISKADYSKYFVSFGILASFDKFRMSHDFSPQQLRETESFLINEFKPVGNDSSTKKGYKGNPIIVFNRTDTILRSLFKKVMTNAPELLKFLKSQLC
jgi:hypothetical protein